VSAEPGNDRNDRNSDPSGDEAILNGGRCRLVFQKDSNSLDHARNVSRLSEWSVNPYRQTTVDPCDRVALVSTARTSRHSVIFLIAVYAVIGFVRSLRLRG
jgi:hypothetical protein